jgi:hypothetical protein
MDVISWAVGLIAGLALPSLRRAIALGALTSVAIRAYQYFLIDPRTWGRDVPEDFFGAAAMIALTALFAWIGSIVRANRVRRAEATS